MLRRRCSGGQHYPDVICVSAFVQCRLYDEQWAVDWSDCRTNRTEWDRTAPMLRRGRISRAGIVLENDRGGWGAEGGVPRLAEGFPLIPELPPWSTPLPSISYAVQTIYTSPKSSLYSYVVSRRIELLRYKYKYTSIIKKQFLQFPVSIVSLFMTNFYSYFQTTEWARHSSHICSPSATNTSHTISTIQSDDSCERRMVTFGFTVFFYSMTMSFRRNQCYRKSTEFKCAFFGQQGHIKVCSAGKIATTWKGTINVWTVYYARRRKYNKRNNKKKKERKTKHHNINTSAAAALHTFNTASPRPRNTDEINSL